MTENRMTLCMSMMASRDIYMMDADGANVRRLTDHPACDEYPAWFGTSGYPVCPAGNLPAKWGWIKGISK